MTSDSTADIFGISIQVYYYTPAAAAVHCNQCRGFCLCMLCGCLTRVCARTVTKYRRAQRSLSKQLVVIWVYLIPAHSPKYMQLGGVGCLGSRSMSHLLVACNSAALRQAPCRTVHCYANARLHTIAGRLRPLASYGPSHPHMPQRAPLVRAATTEAAVSQASEEAQQPPVELLTSDQSDELLRIRHSVRCDDHWMSQCLAPTPSQCAHIMAMAVQRLYPDAKVTIGPWIDYGFYYDFDIQQPLTDKDLTRIQNEMRRIIKKGLPFIREEVRRVLVFLSVNLEEQSLSRSVQ